MRNAHKYKDLDLTGQTFGRLHVIRKAKKGFSWWECKCDCGNVVILPTHRVLTYKSCGCLEKENLKMFVEKRKTHGMANTRLYKTWCGIKERTTNPNASHYENYGGRGIDMCKEWFDNFEIFRKWSEENGYDENKDLSIDRIDVSKGYYPDNCRWADKITQARNRTDTVYVSYKNGERMSARKFAENNGITSYVFVFRRAKKGQLAEQILDDWKIMNDDSGHFLSVNEVSKMLGVTPQTVKAKLKKKEIQGEKHGRLWYVPKEQFEKETHIS